MLPRISPRLAMVCVAFTACLLQTSCAGRKAVYPVAGKVLFKGRPAAGAIVQFHPENPDKEVLVPQGETDSEGNFELTSYEFGDGAPAGQYVVTVIWGVPAKGGDGYDRMLVPPKYMRQETSGLNAVVLAQPTTLEPFQLKP